jgi:hypothetical protein
MVLKWWPGTELNRRRQPFQGCALPPELPGHLSAGPVGFIDVPDGSEITTEAIKVSVSCARQGNDYNNRFSDAPNDASRRHSIATPPAITISQRFAAAQ